MLLMKVMVILKDKLPSNNKVKKLLFPPPGAHPNVNNPNANAPDKLKV